VRENKDQNSTTGPNLKMYKATYEYKELHGLPKQRKEIIQRNDTMEKWTVIEEGP
jgi:hypothetical protein